MENLSRYFVLSTEQQFQQSQAEFTDFVVESTTCRSIKKSDLPDDLFEHETECLYGLKILWKDYIYYVICDPNEIKVVG